MCANVLETMRIQIHALIITVIYLSSGLAKSSRNSENNRRNVTKVDLNEHEKGVSDKRDILVASEHAQTSRKKRNYYCYYYACDTCGNRCYPQNREFTTARPLKPTTTSIYRGKGGQWIGPRRGCNCSIKGSELITCHIVTGQCRCKADYVGLTCDKCREGYYDSQNGCKPCECHAQGSESIHCHPATGQCTCKPGVEGLNCNLCKSQYYGFSKQGCKECEPCNKPGHICDQETGRCACPPHSHGEHCDHCKPNHWGFEPMVGCRNCNCSETGAIRQQCDIQTGSCSCHQGYTGVKCERCAHGYYGYPKCRRCSCHYPGTDATRGGCDPTTGVCQCDDEGNCPCKINVNGRRCNKCREGTFGLYLENQEGCTECFCFGRSHDCVEAGYTWSKIRMKARTLNLDFIDKNYASRAMSPLFLDTNNFQEIEGTDGNVSLSHGHFPIPLYWRLPYQYNNDRILSYGGYLRFTTISTPEQHRKVFSHYPIARIEGNGIKLIHYSPVSNSNKHEIRLHEDNWRLEKIHGSSEDILPITRDILMVTLQRVTGIFIKATDFNSFEYLTIKDLSLDSGVKVLGNPPPLAMGVEQCICPREYNGTSCQNPSLGYYRSHSNSIYHGLQDIDNVIGRSIPCACNSRSTICDIETAYCLQCKENTSGASCEKCAEGYYGDPAIGQCQTCACPTVDQNFAISCVPNPRGNHFSCKCRSGYYGPTCDRCATGYYGQPHFPGGSCKPCNCNLEGSRTTECDKNTGACSCKPGIIGKKCSECSELRHILENNTCVLCDDCIQILLDDLDELKVTLDSNTRHLQNGTLQPPWGMLEKIEQRYLNLSEKVDLYIAGKETINEVYDKKELDILERDVSNIKDSFGQLSTNAREVQNSSQLIKHRSNDLLVHAEQTKLDLQSIKKVLSDFATDHVSTKDALKRGQVLYQNIKKQRGKMNLKVGKIKRQCEEAHRKALILSNATNLQDLATLRKTYQDIVLRTNDLDILLKDIQHKNEIAQLKNSNNEKHLNILQSSYNKIHEQTANINRTMIEKHQLLAETKEKLNSTLNVDLDEINELRDKLDDRISDEFFTNLPEKRQQLEQHVHNLSKTAQMFEQQFTEANKKLEQLKATGKFGATLELIEKARDTYDEAKDTFTELLDTYLEPKDGDTMHDSSSITEAASERLQKRITVIKTNLENDISQKQKRLENEINTLKQLNWDNGLANNNQMEKIHDLKLDNAKVRDIDDVIRAAVGSLEKSRQIHKAAMDLNITKKYNLDKSWDKFLNLTSSKNIRRFKDNMRFTKDLLNNVSQYDGAATNMDVLNQHMSIIEKFNRSRVGIEEKLAKLKNNILKARQIASTISIPLTGSSCGRKYNIPNLEPSTKFLLTMDFTYEPNDTSEKKTIFALRQSPQSYMKLVAYDNLQFIVKRPGILEEERHFWNIAGSKELLKFTLDESNVSITEGDSLVKSFPFYTPSFDISSRDVLEVGLDEENEGANGLPVCIKELAINKKRIGLWEFTETSGECASCSAIRKDLSTNQIYHFNGDSYIAFKGLKYGKPAEINMLLRIKTFDEDAMLMMVYADGPYLAVTLTGGHVHFEMHYNKDVQVQKEIVYTSPKKINNGKEVVIMFTKEYDLKQNKDNVKFEVNKDQYATWENTVAPKNLIKILKANYSFGGLPPDFDTKRLKQGIITTPFLGSLSGTLMGRSLSIEEPSYQIFNVDYFTQNQLSYDKVLLENNLSRLELKLQQRGKLFPLSFVIRIRPKQDNGDILRIANSQKSDNITFKLRDGKLEVNHLGISIAEVESVLDDDEFHIILVDENLCLYIDNIPQNKDECTTNYVQGTYDNFQIEIGGKHSFLGILKELRIDKRDVLISPDTYVTHSRAQIGRSLPLSNSKLTYRHHKIIDDMSMKDMSPPLCEKVHYNLESGAFKFGDSQNSFLSRELKNGFWKSNYSIEFELRTFYSHGLLFLADGNNHYNRFLIRDGFLVLEMKGKKIKKIESQVRIDDGKWHRVVIENMHSLQKKRRKLNLNVDGQKKESKMPHNKISNRLFIGYLPKELSDTHNVQQYRGCLRSLRINQLALNLSDKKTQSVQIGQCFSNIERGTYFRGDSYVVYNRNFRLNNYVDIAFDFRTDQQNGILLSVADTANRPALSIELQNGAVVMSVDMGNGMITNVTNNLARNSACNNEWHKVVASFTTELSVRVDDVIQSWVLSGLEDFRPIEAPLYIGGLPDFAPGGTLKIKENFKGCIRNLSIDNKNVDWINMHELVNVSLNSCPVQV